MTLPTSLPGPSALWAHIHWLRWSFHCPHPTTVFGSPSLQGMSMLESGGHEGPSCLWKAGENSYVHLCPQTPMPSLHPTNRPSPSPSPCCNPSALYSPTWVLPTRSQVSNRSQLLGTMLCSQPGLSAQTEGNQALSPVLSREAGIWEAVLLARGICGCHSIYSTRQAPLPTLASILDMLLGFPVLESCQQHLFSSKEHFFVGMCG